MVVNGWNKRTYRRTDGMTEPFSLFFLFLSDYKIHGGKRLLTFPELIFSLILAAMLAARLSLAGKQTSKIQYVSIYAEWEKGQVSAAINLC